MSHSDRAQHLTGFAKDFASGLDQFALALSPRWAASRENWRKRYANLSSYRSSYRRRIDPEKTGGGSADRHLEFGRERWENAGPRK